MKSTFVSQKKGIFFTVMVLVIVSLLLVSYTFYSAINQRKVIQKRVETMNNFIVSLEDDIPRKMFVAGFRSIFIFNNKIIENGQYINDASVRFEEMFFNASFMDEAQPIMSGATYDDLKNDLTAQGKKINVNVTITGAYVKMDHADPWNIRITLTSNMTIEDATSLARWNKTLVSSGFIPTYHFDDPIYLIGTGGLMTVKVNETNYKPFNVQNLSFHVSEHYYINTTDAPSFIDRLQGDVGANSPYGIESLVNIQEISNLGLNPEQKSITDYIYFSASNPSSCHIANQAGWFYLENSANILARYNASCG